MRKTETQELTEAVQLYLDLMYDGDVKKFDRVFASTSQLHGFREGKMTCWPAAQYKEVLAGRKSPKALGSPREEQILLLDFASLTQALAKVRVRIKTTWSSSTTSPTTSSASSGSSLPRHTIARVESGNCRLGLCNWPPSRISLGLSGASGQARVWSIL